ncbi:flagellar motor protein MotB [uncultured Litoreibacter sp.]|uniref:flagellar motor protein MotB n=1 Tax=uncultured Litoreibacter sp. TaxID=1392394 RepID=UPI0026282C78|nr:flagellar motor protein MotB [uncultured Litoreibacter sp.]
MSDNTRPIIIKRKKVIAGGGHHGGAWKVAYADFVTAMMAFFMLMWLLNATTEKQRKGLADYFSPTIAIARVSGGGDGAFSGDSLMSEETLARSGRGGFADLPPMTLNGQGVDGNNKSNGARELSDLENVQLGIVGRGGESLVRDMAKKHIITRLTDRGLVIEVFDLEDAPLFEPGTARPTPTLHAIADILNEGFRLVTNPVSVAAHAKSISPLFLENPAWEITTDRAQSARALLETAGLAPDRVASVSGFGQQKPLLDDPMSARNNRLEIVLLREDAD